MYITRTMTIWIQISHFVIDQWIWFLHGDCGCGPHSIQSIHGRSLLHGPLEVAAPLIIYMVKQWLLFPPPQPQAFEGVQCICPQNICHGEESADLQCIWWQYLCANKQRFDYCSIIFLNGDIHCKQKGSILYGVLTDNVVTYMSSQVYSVHWGWTICHMPSCKSSPKLP